MEDLKNKHDLSIDEFISNLRELNIPYLKLDEVKNALVELNKFNPPENFFLRLFNCLDYISREEFDKDFETLRDLVFENIPTNYTFAEDHAGSSNTWMYKLLTESSKPVGDADTIIDFSSIGDIRTYRRMDKHNFVIIDDWAITGVQLQDDVIRKIEKISTEPNVKVFLIYSSQTALKKLKERFPFVEFFVVNPSRVKTMDEVLTQEDINFLDSTKEDLGFIDDMEFMPGDTLNMGWWCIPDNVPYIFQKGYSSIGFLAPHDFIKPY